MPQSCNKLSIKMNEVNVPRSTQNFLIRLCYITALFMFEENWKSSPNGYKVGFEKLICINIRL